MAPVPEKRPLQSYDAGAQAAQYRHAGGAGEGEHVMTGAWCLVQVINGEKGTQRDGERKCERDRETERKGEREEGRGEEREEGERRGESGELQLAMNGASAWQPGV